MLVSCSTVHNTLVSFAVCFGVTTHCVRLRCRHSRLRTCCERIVFSRGSLETVSLARTWVESATSVARHHYKSVNTHLLVSPPELSLAITHMTFTD